MKIIVLHQELSSAATSDEADVLEQASAVVDALRRMGHDVWVGTCNLDLAALEARLRREKPDLIFNLVEALGAHSRLAACVPLLAGALGIACTGSNESALLESTHKLRAKRRLLEAGLPTPSLYASDAAAPGRFIVKSVWEHASIGLGSDSVVERAAVAATLATKTRLHGGEFFAEEYVAGRELNVSICRWAGALRVLPIAEIDFSRLPQGRPAIVDYAAKWQVDSAEYAGTQRVFLTSLDNTLAASAGDLALRCFDVFGLEGYARIDMRVADGPPQIVDVNANPCLSLDAGFAAALAHAELPYAEAIHEIALAAVRPQVPKGPAAWS